MSFRKQLIIRGIILTLVPAILTAIVVWRQNHVILAQVRSGAMDLATADLKLLVGSIYERCDSNLALLERSLQTELHVARLTLDRKGQARLEQRGTVAWKVKNQLTGAATTVSLPRMTVGGAWLGQVSDAGTPVPVVDEVSHLTEARATIFHILALNAAVEAARAGDAGQAFRVVADEVRKLAQHCADAARETSEKIANSRQTSREGGKASAQVAQGLVEILEHTRKLDELVTQIADATREQSAGIHLASQTTSQMQRVAQNSAASAEESESASEQLNLQAQALQDLSEELSTVIHGRP